MCGLGCPSVNHAAREPSLAMRSPLSCGFAWVRRLAGPFTHLGREQVRCAPPALEGCLLWYQLGTHHICDCRPAEQVDRAGEGLAVRAQSSVKSSFPGAKITA